jgi:isoleucyl-tRNA synthetase
MVDYREDQRYSEEIVKRVAEAYRKVRNTCRYLLSNLYDFDPAHDSVAESALDELDLYALTRHRQFVARVLQAYDEYEFHVVYHQLVQYCAVDLSAFYLDVLKDRLYCDAAAARRRRSAQTVLYRMAFDLPRLMAPGLPFTADEVYAYLPGKKLDSVLMDVFPKAEKADPGVLSRWQTLLEVRSVVTKKLEEARAAKQIASSLESSVTVMAPQATLEALRGHEAKGKTFPGNLANLFIVSHVALQASEALAVDVARAKGGKCERCWTYSEQVGRLAVHPGVCERCAAVLEGD